MHIAVPRGVRGIPTFPHKKKGQPFSEFVVPKGDVRIKIIRIKRKFYPPGGIPLPIGRRRRRRIV
jgi:hypothetical protein